LIKPHIFPSQIPINPYRNDPPPFAQPSFSPFYWHPRLPASPKEARQPHIFTNPRFPPVLRGFQLPLDKLLVFSHLSFFRYLKCLPPKKTFPPMHSSPQRTHIISIFPTVFSFSVFFFSFSYSSLVPLFLTLPCSHSTVLFPLPCHFFCAYRSESNVPCIPPLFFKSYFGYPRLPLF